MAQMEFGQVPYQDFLFNYGPALIYFPFMTMKLTGLGRAQGLFPCAWMHLCLGPIYLSRIDHAIADTRLTQMDNLCRPIGVLGARFVFDWPPLRPPAISDASHVGVLPPASAREIEAIDRISWIGCLYRILPSAFIRNRIELCVRRGSRLHLLRAKGNAAQSLG